MTLLRGRGARLRVRLTAVAALAGLAAMSVGSALFVFGLHHTLEAGLVFTAQQEIGTIDAQLSRGASAQQVVITGGGVDVVIQLVGADGTVLASDDPTTLGTPLLTAPGSVQDLEVRGEDSSYTVVAEAASDDGPVRLIVVGRSTAQTDKAAGTATLLLAFAIPLLVGLLALVVWVAVGRALRPVEEMRREAESITTARIERRLPQPPGDDEITRLAATLNAMLDRIDRSHRLQRQFVSDASHELRSPLAAIRQSAEVARAYPEHTTMAGLADDVLDESQRMEGLVGALLLLARLDDGVEGGPPEPTDLDDLVLAEVERLRGRSGALTVDLSGVSGGQVAGHPTLLAQVVHNLVDNAFRHATSRIAISVSERDGEVRLVVDDDGHGVSADQQERIFERFVRLDEARTRESGGAGLGLAIVRKIVEQAGGRVRMESSPLGGARVVVALPAAG